MKLILLLLLLPFIQNNPFSQDHVNLWNEIEIMRDSLDVASVSIATIVNGEIDEIVSLGYKDNGKKIKVNNQSAYQVASLSKSVTSTTIYSLTNKGYFNLNSQVNSLINNFAIESKVSNTDSIKVINLLNHTSGVNSEGFYGYQIHKKIPTFDDVLCGKRPAKSKRGIQKDSCNSLFSYSNHGYCYLQKIIEETTDLSFANVVKREVLVPFSMNNSFYGLPDTSQNIALAHWKGKVIKNGYKAYPELATSGLWSTAEDMASFLIQSHQLSKKEPLFVTPSSTTNGKLNEYGLGLELQIKNGTTFFGHTGSTAGYRSFMKINSNNGNGIVILTNSAYSGVDLINLIVPTVSDHYKWQIDSNY